MSFSLQPNGLPVHSFRSLLSDLATLACNTITTAITPDYPLAVVTRPTAIQHKAFDLLSVGCSSSTAFRQGIVMKIRGLRALNEGSSD